MMNAMNNRHLVGYNDATVNSRDSSEMETVFLRDDISDGSSLSSNQLPRGLKKNISLFNVDGNEADEGGNDISDLFHLLLRRIYQRMVKACRCCSRRKCKKRRCCCIPSSSNGSGNYRRLRTYFWEGVSIIKRNDGRYTPSKKTFWLLVVTLCTISTLNYRHQIPHAYNYSTETTAFQKQHYDADYQSYGLFHESRIDDISWSMMKDRVLRTKPHKYANPDTWIDEPNVWYHNNWNQDFTCPFAERVGGDVSSAEISTNVAVGQVSGGGANAAGGAVAQQGWLGDGPKWVCNPRSIVQMVRHRIKRGDEKGFLYKIFHKRRERDEKSSPTPRSPTNGCLVYSIGVNGKELEFEHSIQRLLTREAAVLDYHTHGGYNSRGNVNNKRPPGAVGEGTPFCEIHVFDPDGWHEKLFIGEGIHYHDWGIIHRRSDDTTTDGNVLRGLNNSRNPADDRPSPRFKTFQETVKELGHVGHAVDIMKVDCKLCEWDIFQDWFDRGGGGEKERDTDGNDLGKGTEGLHTIHQLLVEVHGTPEKSVNPFFDKMRDENYVIFHKEPNTQTFGGTCQDYAFLKLRPEFFER